MALRGFGGRGMDQGSNTRFAVITLVRAYWEALRDGAALPRRDRVDPRGLSSALDQVFIAERIAPGIARFRLAGMRINDLLGMEVRGMPLSALFEPAARLRLAPVIEQVFAAPAIAELGLEAERGIGRPAVAARMLLLPLTNSRGLSDLMLGCLAVEGEIGRSPRRFAISRVLQEPLTGLPGMGVTGSGALGLAKAAPRMRLAPGLTEQAGRGFAEQAGTFTPPRGKPHLRLVKSDD